VGELVGTPEGDGMSFFAYALCPVCVFLAGPLGTPLDSEVGENDSDVSANQA